MEAIKSLYAHMDSDSDDSDDAAQAEQAAEQVASPAQVQAELEIGSDKEETVPEEQKVVSVVVQETQPFETEAERVEEASGPASSNECGSEALRLAVSLAEVQEMQEPWAVTKEEEAPTPEAQAGTHATEMTATQASEAQIETAEHKASKAQPSSHFKQEPEVTQVSMKLRQQDFAAPVQLTETQPAEARAETVETEAGPASQPNQVEESSEVQLRSMELEQVAMVNASDQEEHRLVLAQQHAGEQALKLRLDADVPKVLHVLPDAEHEHVREKLKRVYESIPVEHDGNIGQVVELTISALLDCTQVDTDSKPSCDYQAKSLVKGDGVKAAKNTENSTTMQREIIDLTETDEEEEGPGVGVKRCNGSLEADDLVGGAAKRRQTISSSSHQRGDSPRVKSWGNGSKATDPSSPASRPSRPLLNDVYPNQQLGTPPHNMHSKPFDRLSSDAVQEAYAARRYYRNDSGPSTNSPMAQMDSRPNSSGANAVPLLHKSTGGRYRSAVQVHKPRTGKAASSERFEVRDRRAGTQYNPPTALLACAAAPATARFSPSPNYHIDDEVASLIQSSSVGRTQPIMSQSEAEEEWEAVHSDPSDRKPHLKALQREFLRRMRSDMGLRCGAPYPLYPTSNEDWPRKPPTTGQVAEYLRNNPHGKSSRVKGDRLLRFDWEDGCGHPDSSAYHYISEVVDEILREPEQRYQIPPEVRQDRQWCIVACRRTWALCDPTR